MSLSTEKLTEMQNGDIFRTTLLKMINERTLSSPVRYFVDNEKLLHKVMREVDKTFHALVVPQTLTKHV